MKRECGDCTKCCEGNLTFTIKDIKVYGGKPCPFVDIHKGVLSMKIDLKILVNRINVVGFQNQQYLYG